MTHFRKLLVALIALMGGVMMETNAQNGCDQSECTEEYCITNQNVDCYIQVDWEVICDNGYQESGGTTLGPSSCENPPTHECFELPDCDSCDVYVWVEGVEFDPRRGQQDKCVTTASCGTTYGVDYHPTNGTCIHYDPDCGFTCN